MNCANDKVCFIEKEQKYKINIYNFYFYKTIHNYKYNHTSLKTSSTVTQNVSIQMLKKFRNMMLFYIYKWAFKST